LRRDGEKVPGRALIIAITLSVGGVPLRSAWAAERLAVLVAGATAADRDLAAVVSEVVESQVARTDAEIAGVEELRGKMELKSEIEVAACLRDLDCLSRAAIALRVRRLITGTVGRSDTEHFFSLEWRDMEEASTPPRRVFRRVTGGLPDLGRSAQTAVDELLRPPQLEARRQSEASPVLVSPAPTAAPPAHKSWPTKAVWAGLGVTAIALGTGAVFATLSHRQPEGTTRGAFQRSLDDLQRQGAIADAALITAAITGLVTTAIIVRYWNHIFGTESRSSP
jgi:hypothetical protein